MGTDNSHLKLYYGGFLELKRILFYWLICCPNESVGVHSLKEEIKQERGYKNNTSGEAWGLYFYANVVVRKGLHLGSNKEGGGGKAVSRSQ